jgi:hypothetical protein
VKSVNKNENASLSVEINVYDYTSLLRLRHLTLSQAYRQLNSRKHEAQTEPTQGDANRAMTQSSSSQTNTTQKIQRTISAQALFARNLANPHKKAVSHQGCVSFPFYIRVRPSAKTSRVLMILPFLLNQRVTVSNGFLPSDDSDS